MAAWRSIRLGDVCSKIGSGATPRGGSDIYTERGAIAFIRSQNVHNQGFRREGLARLDDERASTLGNVEVLPEDVLLNITGDSVARVCQVDPAIIPARVNQHVAIIRPDPHRLDPRFLRYALVSPEMQRKLLSWAGAGGTRNALTKSMIGSIEMSVPDICEQNAIGQVLGSLDDKIELNRRMSGTLEIMARTFFKSWFVDFDPVRARADGRDPRLPEHVASLFPSRFVDSDLGEVPEGWSIGTLADLATLNPEAWTKESRPAQIAYVELSGTKWGRIETLTSLPSDEAPSRAQRVLRPGDTILGTVRPANGSYALIAETGLTGSTGFAVLRPKTEELAEFVYLAATAAENIEMLGHLADGAAYPAVRAEVVAATSIVIPEHGVANLFAQVAGALLGRFSHNERESRTLAELRDALLPKLVSGELRVRDAESFLARVL